jgi:hypothetical protein
VLRLRVEPSPAVGRQRVECMQPTRRRVFRGPGPARRPAYRPPACERTRSRVRPMLSLVSLRFEEPCGSRELAPGGLERLTGARQPLACGGQIDRLTRRLLTLK